MKKTIAVIFLLVLLEAVPFSEPLRADSLIGDAGPRGYYVSACRRWHRQLKKLNRTMSPEQKDAVIALIKEYRSDTEQYRADLVDARKALFVTVHKLRDALNEADIRESFEDVADLREEIAVQYGEMVFGFQQVLRPGQYRAFIRARRNMYICAHAPLVIFNRTVDGWIKNNS
ncbi:MAG: hypothetical protein D6719_05910 [Candidatus Dadabacteria bacterium]|nr:MAG: hypothetical protein D6719_05910 [Candidatus Dadabacteria bacterium]